MPDFTPPPRFPVSVDLVILTVRDDHLCALLIRRRYPPFAGVLALPGGFVLDSESLDEAAARELAEETGVRDGVGHLEQLATYGAVRRDPRERVVTVAYMALAPSLPVPQADTDAAEAGWFPVEPMLAGAQPLAFDHLAILTDGVERARAKLEYSALATAFCGEEFTIGELRGVYEAVWGVRLDPRNFHRKATSTPGFLVATGRTAGGSGRPAATYRLASSDPAGVVLHPPLLRP